MYQKIQSRYPKFKKEKLESFVSSVNSYLGLMRHYKTYKIRKKFINTRIKKWLPYIEIVKNYHKINMKEFV